MQFTWSASSIIRVYADFNGDLIFATFLGWEISSFDWLASMSFRYKAKTKEIIELGKYQTGRR